MADPGMVPAGLLDCRDGLEKRLAWFDAAARTISDLAINVPIMTLGEAPADSTSFLVTAHKEMKRALKAGAKVQGHFGMAANHLRALIRVVDRKIEECKKT